MPAMQPFFAPLWPGLPFAVAVSPAGRLQQQLWQSNEGSFYQLVISAAGPLQCQFRTAEPFTIACMVQQGRLLWQQHTAAITIGSGHYSLLRMAGTALLSVTSGLHRCLLLVWDEAMLASRLLHFPRLEWLQPPGPFPPWPTIITPPAINGLLPALPGQPYTAGILSTNLLAAAAQSITSPLPYTTREREQLQEAKMLLDSHFPRYYPIAALARAIGMNRDKLKTGFKLLFGVTIYAYHKTAKITVAQQQLAGSHKSIKQVARLAGYKSIPSFCKAFKAATLLTPAAYRRNNQ
jgi:AraC-like DNA-binding protein